MKQLQTMSRCYCGVAEVLEMMGCSPLKTQRREKSISNHNVHGDTSAAAFQIQVDVTVDLKPLH